MSIVRKIVSHPVVKTAFVGGFVLGARAGRARFDQIRSLAGRFVGAARPGSGAEATTGTPSAQGPPDPTPTGPVFPAPARPGTGTSAPVPDPDEHVEPGVRLAYSTGPDVEETIDELRATDPDDRV